MYLCFVRKCLSAKLCMHICLLLVFMVCLKIYWYINVCVCFVCAIHVYPRLCSIYNVSKWRFNLSKHCAYYIGAIHSHDSSPVDALAQHMHVFPHVLQFKVQHTYLGQMS